MSDYWLIVSDPPHGDVDYVQALPCFRLTQAEVKMKANYGLPEIWFAGKDRDAMVPTFDTLRDAGMGVIFLSAADLRSVPARTEASAVEVSDTGLEVTADGGAHTIPYESRVLVVHCEPKRERAAAARSSTGTAMGRLSHSGLTPDTLVGRGQRGRSRDRGDETASEDFMGFVDVFVVEGAATRRFSFAEGRTDLSKLTGSSPREQLTELVTACESRFTACACDRRLVGMTVRRRVLVGEYPDDERRKGFSFATRALSQLLEAISPDLKRVTDTEHATRLAFLTRSAR